MDDMKVQEINVNVNGVEYVPKSAVPAQPVMDASGFSVIRTRSAGVFAGWLADDYDGGLVGDIVNSRRLWYWSGANELSQLAMEGVKNPSACKFAPPTPITHLTEIIEVIACTETAFKIITAVPEWKK